jgi:hypothetical protein
MLGGALLSTVKSQYERTIDMLGVAATWTKANTPASTAAITIGSRIASDKDDAILNAYGIGALIFTLKATDFPVNPPTKFDTLKIGGEVYVIDHVSPVHMNGQVFGYRCYSRGK